jgi:hypothetical protein
MISRQNRRLGILLATGLVGLAFGGCSSSPGNPTSTGGTSSGGPTGGSSGGVVSTGGSSTSGGSVSTGGSIATGGAPATGGAVATGGGTPGGTSGTSGYTSTGGASGATPGGASMGGAATGGAGGAHAGAGGVSTGTGGAGKGGASNGGASATGGASAGGSGGSTSGTCQKGQTKGSDVVIMGESFYAIAPQYIEKRIEDNARKAGSLGANETYRNVAVSGQNMNYIATTEWAAATQGGATFKYIIMDGGGIDCLTGSSCPTCVSTFKTLLGKMATAGVTDVIYTRYPEPGAPPGSNTALKACLDATMPNMQTACEGSTSPRCHWVDLRPVWTNADTTDGLHPTQSGGEHVGDLLWSEMVKACFAQ